MKLRSLRCPLSDNKPEFFNKQGNVSVNDVHLVLVYESITVNDRKLFSSLLQFLHNVVNFGSSEKGCNLEGKKMKKKLG